MAATPGGRARSSALRLRALPLVPVVILAAAWWLVATLELVRPVLVPPLGEFLAELAEITVSPRLWEAVSATAVPAVLGTALAAVVAVPVGLLLGTSPRAERATRLLIDVGRSFPVIALLPVVVLVLGATTQMKITLIFLACLFPLVIQTTNGARRLEATLVATVRSYQLPWFLRFRKVLLPQAAPFIATGLRIAITTAVLVAVGAEVLTQTQGLGRRITLAQSAGRTALGYAYIFYAALLGVAINALANGLERRLIRWQRAETE